IAAKVLIYSSVDEMGNFSKRPVSSGSMVDPDTTGPSPLGNPRPPPVSTLPLAGASTGCLAILFLEPQPLSNRAAKMINPIFLIIGRLMVDSSFPSAGSCRQYPAVHRYGWPRFCCPCGFGSPLSAQKYQKASFPYIWGPKGCRSPF